jgi:hypothetical protein
MKIAIAAAICVLTYVGAYVALLQTDCFWFCSLGYSGSPYQRVAEFRIGGERAKTIFGPLLWVDQTIRPTYWAGVRLFDGRSVSGNDPRASGLVQGAGFSGAPPSETSQSEAAR